MATSNGQFDMLSAPMRIGTVRLKVRDLNRVSTFYQDALGLDLIETAAGREVLGSQGAALLELRGEPGLAPFDRRQAGLFHTAFLMPTRGDLARWLIHVANQRVRLDGASDHIVSEAIYLSDPEGNGIEVYADRPFADWGTATGEVRMSTDPLDLDELMTSAAGRVWHGFPEGGSIGHVHLQVGDTPVADRFYRDVLGFDIAARYPGASFYGSGGYHHQLAGNVWNSGNAGARPEGMAGLETVGITVREPRILSEVAARAGAQGVATTCSDARLVLDDPWGNRLELTA